MDKEKLTKLADMIEAAVHTPQPIGFNMGDFITQTYTPTYSHTKVDWDGTCGTVGCIAGWACFMEDPDWYIFEGNQGHVWDRAERFLGLSERTAEHLFTPPLEINYSAITAGEAVQTIRKLIETGEVDWSHVPRMSDEEFEDCE